PPTRGRVAMAHRTIHGFAWYATPDIFAEEVPDPGHPFCSCPGEIATPEEVIYFRPFDPADAGVDNERRTPAYLVISKTQLHPRLCKGWESEPAALSDKFKTADGKVRMVRVVHQHHRHAGKLLECELRVEGN